MTSPGLRRTAALTALGGLALAGVLVAGGGDRPDRGATWPPGQRAGQAPSAPSPPDRVAMIRERNLPNVPLTTHDGRSVRFYDDLVKGRVVAINFMFTTCGGSCPVTTANLVQVRHALADRAGRDVTFLSISLDPDRDTPDVLATYARAFGAGPGWYFLTGNREDIDHLRRKLGVYARDPLVDADPEQHAGLVVLGNEPRGRWKAVPALAKPVRIRQAIERTLLPPGRWPTGQAVVDEARLEVMDTVELGSAGAAPSPGRSP